MRAQRLLCILQLVVGLGQKCRQLLIPPRATRGIAHANEHRQRHGIDPFDYLKDLFTRLPAAEQVSARLPRQSGNNNRFMQRFWLNVLIPAIPKAYDGISFQKNV